MIKKSDIFAAFYLFGIVVAWGHAVTNNALEVAFPAALFWPFYVSYMVWQ